MTKHKWYNEIVAWASGAEIEIKWPDCNDWGICISPQWDSKDREYRIKPQPKEPQYLYVYEGCPLLLSLQPFAQYSDKIIGKIKLEQDDE